MKKLMAKFSVSPKLTKTLILAVLILLTLFFIFSNSFESQEASNAKSTALTDLLNQIFGSGTLENPIIRKLAHITEFAVLGSELAALAFLYRLNLTSPLFAGLLCALTDETIQIFTGRGSMVSDVWIDFTGVCAGTLAISVLISAVGKRRKKRA